MKTIIYNIGDGTIVSCGGMRPQTRDANLSQDRAYIEVLEAPHIDEYTRVDHQTGEIYQNDPPLEVYKYTKWREFKSMRNAQEFGSFTWNGMLFQCDEVSQRRIQGALQLANLDPSINLTWTLADNTTTTLNQADIVGLATALATHVNACHTESRRVRGLVDAAVSIQDLDAITWDYNPV